MQLGQILPSFPREKAIVQTKVSPDPDPQKFRQDFEQSLAYLNLDYVDLFALHGINTPEILHDSLRDGGCLDVARQLQAEGKLRFIGFSTHGPTATIVEAIATNAFDYVNLHWYYINQDNWPAIAAARRHDMGVFIISPADKGGKLYDPSPKLVELCRPLSPITFNDLFCLSHPEVHTLSIGAARPSDFDEHLTVLDAIARADEILPPIIERLERAAIDALGEEWMKTWRIGLPSHEQVPGDINIAVILWLRNLAIAYDAIDYARMRYNLLGNGGHWFPGQKADRLDEFDLSECLQHSPHRTIIPRLLAETHQLLGGRTVQRLSKS
jgi:hypothetical protein